MSTSVSCPVCFDPITAENPGVRLARPYKRMTPKHKFKPYRGDVLACHRCATTHDAGADGKENLFMVWGREFTDGWERHECRNCALPILLAPSKLRKAAFCSSRCRVAVVRAKQKAVQVPVTHKCDGCGNEVVGGRADRKFCSAACRQKAYRNRELDLQQTDAEFLTDIRQTLRTVPTALRQRNLSPRALQIVINDAKELIDTLTEDLIEATVRGQERHP